MLNRPTTSAGPPSSRGPSLRRLLLLVVGALVLVLPATVALATGHGASDRAPQAADNEDDGNSGKNHCEDEESGPGHKDCPPDNNSNPDNPPCDADHGHPAENAKKCQEGPENPGSCEDGIDNDQDGHVDDEDPDCDGGSGGPCEGAGGDSDGDGVCDDDDDCPNEAGSASNNGCPDEGGPCEGAGGDSDGDGVCDDDDDCPNEAGPASNNGCPENAGVQNLCTAAEDDPGLPLTEDTVGQTLWDGGLDALNPLTEDPERDGSLSGPIGDAGTDTPLEPVTDEASCAVDLLIDSELGGDL